MHPSVGDRIQPKQSTWEVLAAWRANGAQILDSQWFGLYHLANSAAAAAAARFEADSSFWLSHSRVVVRKSCTLMGLFVH